MSKIHHVLDYILINYIKKRIQGKLTHEGVNQLSEKTYPPETYPETNLSSDWETNNLLKILSKKLILKNLSASTWPIIN